MGLRSLILAVAAIVLTAAAGWTWVAGRTWYTVRDHDLSQKPPRSARQRPLERTPSSVAVSATVTYSALAEALDKALPPTFSADGRQKVCADLRKAVPQTVQRAVGGDIGRLLGQAARAVTEAVTTSQTKVVCQNAEYTVTVSRTTPLSVTRSGDRIRVSLGVSASGEAGFTGDLAKALALDKKNFRGGVQAFADITADLDASWCPHFQVTPGFTWTDRAQLEVVRGVWLNIDGQVGDKINEKMKEAVARLQSAVKCEAVQKAVASVWRPYSVPLSLPTDPPTTVHANLTPNTIGFSGFRYEDTGLRLALGIEALTEVTGAPPPAAAMPARLPPLQRIAVTSDKLGITLPVRVSYDQAVIALRNLLQRRPFEADTPQGHVTFTVDDVTLYPSDGKLALGLRFRMATGNRFLDTKGWVYLVGAVVADQTGQMVRVQDLQLTRQIDNDMLSTLSTILDGQLKALIEGNAVYDLRPRIADLRSRLDAQLSDIARQQNIVVAVNDSFVGLTGVQLREQDLEVGIGLQGTAKVEVNAIALPLR
jgi:hypothetical protein